MRRVCPPARLLHEGDDPVARERGRRRRCAFDRHAGRSPSSSSVAPPRSRNDASTQPPRLSHRSLERGLPAPAGRRRRGPPAANRQPTASGHSPHRGAGRHTNRPRSISAWFHSPGAAGSTIASASACRAAGRDHRRARRRDEQRAVTRRTFVSTAADRAPPNAIEATARRRVRTDPGQRPELIDVRRHRPPWSRDDRAGGLAQGEGAARIAQAAPGAQELGARGRGQRPTSGNRSRNESVGGRDPRRLRLLQHHLGDQHRVGSGRALRQG